ncbi:MAG: DUF4157 domain-containing protein, partial [Myxococcota bacterium]
MKTQEQLSQALLQLKTTPAWTPNGFDTCMDVETNVQMRNACGVTSQALLAHLEHGRPPVQRQADGSPSTASVHQLAAEGLRGSPQSLPHLETIQHSFGRHAIGGVQAHVGGPAQVATQRMGAEAYATGNSVAFKRSPDLHTAAHEAAHIVQQRAGVQLKGGVGQVGDPYEQHADAVADAVVQGKSAEPLLDRFVGNSGSTSADVQHKRTLGSERLSSSAPLIPLKSSQGFTVGRTGQAIQFQDDKKEGDNGGLVYEGNVGRETELDEEGKPKSKEQRDAEKAAEEAKTPEQRDAERRKPSTQTERKSTTSGKMTVDKDKMGAQVTHTRSFKASCTIPLPAFPALRLVFEFEAKASGSASADTTGAFSIKGTLSVGGSVGAALDFGFISATVKGGIEATCDAINIARAAGGSWTLSAMTGDVTGQVVFEGELKIPGLSDIFDGFVAGNKITYPLTKKGTFLTFSGGGIHIPGSDKPDDGRMIPATVTTPWSVSVGPDLQDLLVRLGLATERAKSGLGKAVLSKV